MDTCLVRIMLVSEDNRGMFAGVGGRCRMLMLAIRRGGLHVGAARAAYDTGPEHHEGAPGSKWETKNLFEVHRTARVAAVATGRLSEDEAMRVQEEAKEKTASEAGRATVFLVLLACASAAKPLPTIKHSNKKVLLLSFDGLHSQDVQYMVSAFPSSNIAMLANGGVRYDQAYITTISDSFPGLLSLVTGGTVKSTGVYYDVNYDRTLYCSDACVNGTMTPGLMPGCDVAYDESLDKDMTLLSGGGDFGFSSIDPTMLPFDKNCNRVYPHTHVRVNNIFEVAKSHGFSTAWSDKHPGAYTMLYGPSGLGLDQFYSPEINSNFPNTTASYTSNPNYTMIYDDTHTNAVIGWIHGKSPMGYPASSPNLFGCNFQSLSVAQKIGASLGSAYNADLTPGPYVLRALQHLDAALGKIQAALRAAKFADATIILTAKHGQSPINHALCNLIPDHFIADQINNALGAGAVASTAATDDGSLIYLADSSKGAAAAAALMANATFLGIDKALYGAALVANGFADPMTDSRAPDIIIKVVPGTIYASNKAVAKQSKCAEHGGVNDDDRHVGLIISGPGVPKGKVYSSLVSTTQVAPSILKMFDINPRELQAVVKEGTKALPYF
ncbi:MAG: hypothetical protein WDW38_000788 [Sanguina aurantia]